MDDVSAGSSPGAQQGPTGLWGGGIPPWVLLGAMGAALLIAVTLIAYFIGSGTGGGDVQPASSGGSSATDDSDGRVRLRVTIDGSGGGQITVTPADIACSKSCTNDIVSDTRVRVTADADIGSTFNGWSDTCTGKTSCAFFMDRSRALGATFDTIVGADEAGPDCDNDGLPDRKDPGSCDDPPPTPTDGGLDCKDGIDNDGDGLQDAAQDPGCEFGSEAATAPPSSDPDDSDPDDLDALPPPPGTPKDCGDGKDNDDDGLIDKAQDPGCDKYGTEADD